jgi:hypothetical protein
MTAPNWAHYSVTTEVSILIVDVAYQWSSDSDILAFGRMPQYVFNQTMEY